MLASCAMACGAPGAAGGHPLDDALRFAQATTGDAEMLLAVDVNAQAVADAALVLRRADGSFWICEECLRRWRLRVPDVAPYRYAGAAYFPLAAIAGVRYAFDAAAAKLDITAPPDAFIGSTLSTGTRAYPPPVLPSPGGFFTHDVVASRASGRSSVAGQFEAGVFSRYGVVTSSFFAQGGDVPRDMVRLDTTYTRDFPERLETLRVGDTATFPGLWGRSLRIGGVQYGSNFATQPGFVTFPTIAANGSAVLPSTVDVFVDNALVAQRSVPPGPFSITNIPTVSGSGNVQLVVRDLLGREQVVSEPFYSTARLLAPGLSEYSVEGGLVRRNYGVSSADYGVAIGSATYRRGLTPELTIEGRAEGTRANFAAGGGADWLLGEIGVLRGFVAASGSSRDGAGALVGGGFERRTGLWTVAMQVDWASSAFRSSGVADDAPLPRVQAAATLGAQFGRYGSFTVTAVEQDFRSRADLRLVSFGYTVSLASFGFFSVSAIRTLGTAGSAAVTATLTVPLGSRDWASVAYIGTRGNDGGNTHDVAATLQRSLPAGEGFGYQIVARTHSDVQAGVAYQNDYATTALDATRFQGKSAVRAGVAGGVGMLGGHVFASRTITDSFAIVQVDDYAGVGILQDNQPVGRTNASGYAVLPRLRAYDINPIAIVQQDLPLDAKVERLALDAVPYYRSGALVEFPVRHANGATLKLRLDDGGYLPPGATVDVIGGESSFPVANDGEVYVTGLRSQNRLRAMWRGRSCEFDIALPSSRNPLPDLGVVECHGIAR